MSEDNEKPTPVESAETEEARAEDAAVDVATDEGGTGSATQAAATEPAAEAKAAEAPETPEPAETRGAAEETAEPPAGKEEPPTEDSAPGVAQVGKREVEIPEVEVSPESTEVVIPAPEPVNMETHAAAPQVDEEYQKLVRMYDDSMRNLAEGEVVTGTVIEINEDEVIVDVGYKSEGIISRDEFTDRQGNLDIEVGDEIDVLLEKTEDIEGHVLLSRQKALRMKRWNEIEKAYKGGEIIKGTIVDRIKGGLTVDVGLRAFLPGSLVDIKPIKHLESLKGDELEFKVISLDRRRNNIVLSRKAVLEKELEKKKKETLTKLKEGALLKGVVKNITDYGVFVDLGGIDGLLHITDISWGRVNHPSEHFAVGDEVEVVILKFDPETERVSLGYKQRTEDPWNLVDKKYPIGSRVHGRVVSIVDYGAFVEIEEGVEGLIHVSEMSWTKKVVNPAKIVDVGDEVEAIVSELDMDQRRISLSLRQTERNPWEELEDTHPVGTIIEGVVRNLTEFGAFVEITEGIDGLIHVSDMSWTKRVKHPSEVLKKSDVVKARITNIDSQNQRVSLSIKEFMPNEWEDFVSAHHVGDTVDGRVVNVTDFGLFIDIYQGLEGLAHISEIDVPPGSRLEDQYPIDTWVRARILRIEEHEKKVGLTMRGVLQPTADEMEALEKEAAERDDDDQTREQAKAHVVVESPEAEEEATEEGVEGEVTEGEKAEAAKAEKEEPDEAEEAAEEPTGDEEETETKAEAEPEEEDAAESEAATEAEAEGDDSEAEAVEETEQDEESEKGD
jgi:small subunit ribosomal protein S1